MLNYYRILGVNPDADTSEIRRAFRLLARRHHPDAGGDEELFKQIGIAFYVLSDPQSREEYDRQMHFREEIKAPTGLLNLQQNMRESPQSLRSRHQRAQ